MLKGSNYLVLHKKLCALVHDQRAAGKNNSGENDEKVASCIVNKHGDNKELSQSKSDMHTYSGVSALCDSLIEEIDIDSNKSRNKLLISLPSKTCTTTNMIRINDQITPFSSNTMNKMVFDVINNISTSSPSSKHATFLQTTGLIKQSTTSPACDSMLSKGWWITESYEEQLISPMAFPSPICPNSPANAETFNTN